MPLSRSPFWPKGVPQELRVPNMPLTHYASRRWQATCSTASACSAATACCC
jgi:hypothetical protein